MTVLKQGTTLALTLGKGSAGAPDGAEISLPLENYLVPGPRLGQAEKLCYLPIFVADPGSDLDTFEAWFMGNMFMDKYVVINDVETFDKSKSTDTTAPLRIGLYRKPSEEEGGVGSAVLATLFSLLFVAAAAILFCLYKKKRARSDSLDGRSLPAVRSHIDTSDRQEFIKKHENVEDSGYSDNETKG